MSLFKILRGLFDKSDFLRNTFTVASGTAVAQIFPILFYPILARIFPPSEFGLLAIIVSIVPIMSVIASGAYEGAILLSKSKESSVNLVAYILIRSVLVLAFFFCIVVFFGELLALLLNEPRIENWLYLIPIISLGLILVNISNEWFVKYKYFSKLSLNKALYTITNVLSKFFIGFFALLKTGGLILGDLVGKIVMIFYVAYRFNELESPLYKSVSRKKVFSSYKEVKDFPRFVMPDQIISNLAGSIHVFFISAFFGVEELGYVAIVSSILYAPITVFSSAIKDVFRQRAKEDIDASGNCRPLFIKLLVPITLVALVGFGVLYFLIPTFFSVFLGDQWTQAGIYAQIMIPLFFFSFIAMALKDVFIVVEKMYIALYWQIFFIISLSFSLYLSIYFYKDIEVTLYFMTLANSLSFLFYLCLSYIYAKR